MSKIEVRWHDAEKTILDVIYSPGWTWEDYHQTIQTVAEMKKDITHPVVHFNINLEGFAPANNPLPHVSKMSRTHTIHTMIIVTKSDSFRRIARVMLETVNIRENHNLWFFDDIDKARQFASQRLKETE